MQVLVTGARGFVGLNVTHTLARAGHQVLALDRSPLDGWVDAFLRDVGERVEHLECDLTHRGALVRMVDDRKLDAVIHAAVVTATTVEVEIRDARDIVDSNAGGTIEALECAVARGARRFVYVSSPAALGDVSTASRIDEAVVPAPVNLYGITKLASEQIVWRWGSLHPLETVSVRIAQPYGPGERATGARVRTSPIWEWLEAATGGDPLASGPLDRARDWTFIGDTARGIAELATSATLSHDLYHLSCGEPVEVGAVIKALERHFGPLDVDTAPPAGLLNPNIAGPGRPPLDPGRFEREFGWKPATPFDEGMDRYAGWWNDFRKER